MRGARWQVMLVALAALAAGCNSDDPRPASEQPHKPAPTQVSPSTAQEPISQAQQASLDGFLARTKPVTRVGAEFELREVQYTSPRDAVAQFLTQHRVKSADAAEVIATTDDNWAHAAGLSISDDLADLVSYVPLGRGAVAIKARNQFTNKAYPPFVLYPDGEVKPLLVATEPRALEADDDLLEIDLYDFFSAIHAGGRSEGLWAADVAAGEIFRVAGSPFGQVLQHVPGRDGAVLSVAGYQKDVGDGVWRFETSADTGGSWQQTDVRLPLGRKPIWRHADSSIHAVGPGRLQAIAMADYLPDMPPIFRELWRTNDEKEFHLVPLPLEPMAFIGGIAFAADGALLLAEVQGPDTYCAIDAVDCNRPGRIWRLPRGGTQMRLLADAPSLFGPFWAVGIKPSGGVIVARTGARTIAVSKDGYTWTEVSPGR